MASSKSSKKAPKKAEPAKDSAPSKAKGKAKAASNPAPTLAPLALADVRSKIDQIDRDIQSLIAERARFAHQVGKAKGKLAAAVDYYRPEREAQVLRMVVDRNEGPLSDELLVHVYREIMSACLAQQEPLKIGYLGPEGTFSQQAVLKHFGRSALGLPMASIEEVFQEVEAGNADFGVVPVENSTEGVVSHTLDQLVGSSLSICGEVALAVREESARQVLGEGQRGPEGRGAQGHPEHEEHLQPQVGAGGRFVDDQRFDQGPELGLQAQRRPGQRLVKQRLARLLLGGLA